ncbi:MAG: ABC transporter substrate-binding protein [Cyanobacteria bacterium P01_C01_bin.72]
MKILSRKSQRFLLIAIAFFCSLIFFWGAGRFLRSQDAVYLAVVGPTEGENVSGREMVQGVQLYLDQVNRQGGINGRKVKLEIFDDRNDVATAKAVANKIAASSNALAVLGHYYSSTSLAGGEIYRQAGIPAISASATADSVTRNNDWYARVIFNNSLQASFIANYANKILQYTNASIIYSDDDYGITLKESFTNTFSGLGGAVRHQWALDPDAADFKQQQQQIIQDLQASNQNQPEIIFCATHNGDIVDLIVQMKRQQLDYPLIGADSLGSVAFAQKFQQYAEEQKSPGYFSDGIYAVAPIIFDVANEQAQKFRNGYINKYESEPGWAAATYYDAAEIAVAAIAKAQITAEKSKLEQERQKVQEILAQTNNSERAIAGLSGQLYFDDEGNSDNSIYIGTFTQQKFISAFTQLQPINNIEIVEDLQSELDSGRILLVDGKYRHRTNIVYTGIDINEIRNLDEKTSSYLVDFYLWFRFQGDIDADNIEFINYGTNRMDSGEKLELDEPINQEEVDGVKYRVYRVKADFQEEFWFHDYPFDRQKLAVKFRHLNQTRENLIYVVDVVGMRDTVAQEVLENWRQAKVFDTISDWKVREVSFFPDTQTNDSTLGNPRLFNANSSLQYSRFNAVIGIKRDTINFSIKNLLPLLFFIALSYLLLYLPLEAISVEAVSGTLLAIVFFHLSLLEGLPEGIGYVVALDYAFYVIYALIILELLLVVVGNKPEIRSNKLAVKRLILIARIVFPAILVISAIALFARYGAVDFLAWIPRS